MAVTRHIGLMGSYGLVVEKNRVGGLLTGAPTRPDRRGRPNDLAQIVISMIVDHGHGDASARLRLAGDRATRAVRGAGLLVYEETRRCIIRPPAKESCAEDSDVDGTANRTLRLNARCDSRQLCVRANCRGFSWLERPLLRSAVSSFPSI
jgi:hypothetical protein